MNKITLTLAILFLVTFSLTFVSSTIAYDNYQLKWQLCSALNFTGMACDVWWGSFADVQPNISNVNISAYCYSKGEIDAMFQNFTGNSTSFYYLNLSSNLTAFISKSDLDNATLTLRNSIMDNYISNSTFYSELSRYGYSGYNSLNNTNTPGNNINPLWVIGGVIILIGGFIVYQNSRKKGKGNQSPVITNVPISSEKQQIATMMIELEKMKNKQENQGSQVQS